MNKTESIVKLWFKNGRIYILTDQGNTYSRPLEAFPLLLEATPEQREAFEIGSDGDDIRWDELDEDIHALGGHGLEGLLPADGAAGLEGQPRLCFGNSSSTKRLRNGSDHRHQQKPPLPIHLRHQEALCRTHRADSQRPTTTRPGFGRFFQLISSEAETAISPAFSLFRVSRRSPRLLCRSDLLPDQASHSFLLRIQTYHKNKKRELLFQLSSTSKIFLNYYTKNTTKRAHIGPFCQLF